ncbi:DinB family protein [Metabacillus sp. Hm71]|uniref:DinB family protein n=1 Tax=Metabacillus sp. Hm71 TaxID=3450743 RepID=UPI003F4365E2
MDQLLLRQFERSREYLIKILEPVSPEHIDVQPGGFNNTIHWHAGHVLTITEQTMFGFPQLSTHLPVNYVELFGNGTKPADWKGEIPPIEQLIVQLKDQITRIKEIPAERLDLVFEKPIIGCQTYGELAGFTVIHEATHIGQIQAMKRVIEVESVKS